MTDLASFTPLIHTLLSAATDSGAEAEILISGGKAVSVRVFKGKVEQFKHTDGLAIGVRAVIDGSEGIAYTERTDEAAGLETVREAVANAKICRPPYPASLSTPPPLPSQSSFYNPALESLDITQMTAFAAEMEAAAEKSDPRIINVPYAVCATETGVMRICSTRGIDRIQYDNSVSAYVSVLAETDGERRSGGEFVFGRQFSTLNQIQTAQNAVQEALSLLGGIPLPRQGHWPVILRHEAFADLLGAFAGLFSAKQVHDGRSLLAGKLNHAIAAARFSLIDDPLRPDGPASQNFDSEGFPAKKLTLIQNGTLCSYLHNSLTAAEDGVVSTGHAARSPKSSLGIAPSNWIVEIDAPLSRHDFYSTEPEMILVHGFQGLHAGVNAVSGDFSLMAEGFLIRHGKVVSPLKPFTVSGNFLTLLTDIQNAGDDFKMTAATIGTPSVHIAGLGISG